MPIINAAGCPIHVEIEGSDDAARSSCRIRCARRCTCGRAGSRHSPGVPLVRYDRRLRQVRRAERALHAGTARPRRARDQRMGSASTSELVRASLGGMEGMWLGANAGDLPERLVRSATRRAISRTRRDGTIAPAGARKAAAFAKNPWNAGYPGLSGARPADHRLDDRDVLRRRRRAMSAAARRCATWTTARFSRGSPYPRS